MREFSRLSAEQLATGLRRVNKYNGFFNLPAFVRLCTEVDFVELGLPEPDLAFHEACRNAHSLRNSTWSHPAVYHAGADVGWFELQRAAYNGPEFHTFKDCYFERSKQAQANTLPPIPSVELIPEKLNRKASPETRAKYMAQIRSILNG